MNEPKSRPYDGMADIEQEPNRRRPVRPGRPALLCYPGPHGRSGSGRVRAVDPALRRAPAPHSSTAARAIEIVFHPAGTRLLTRGGEPSQHLYVIRKGAVRLEREGQTVQLLEEGEVFGFTSLISGTATLDVTVEEDLLAYRLPRVEFEALLAHAAFAGHFASGLAERLRNSLERSGVASFQPDLGVPVATLLRGRARRARAAHGDGGRGGARSWPSARSPRCSSTRIRRGS